MQLLLIRHALPVRMEVTEGTADPHLDDRGHAQASLLAEYLAAEQIDALYASPMLRAQQTAQPVSAKLRLAINTEDDIAESDRKGTFYAPADQLKAAGDPRWRQGFTASDWPEEHEPLEEFHSRVMAGMERIIERHPGQTVAVVCHGGVIARYTSTILNHPWEEIGFFLPHYTSITRVNAGRTGRRGIVTLNETPHLRGTDLPTGAI